MKKIIKLLIPLMLFAFCIKVNALEYDINKATFDVVLEPSGDAVITESWDLEYLEGGFTRFYKEIYKHVTEVEKYNGIDFIDAYIGGEEVTKTFDYANRPDSTYGIEEEGKVYRVNFYKRINEARKENYKITYRVKNVVKATDDDKAIFVYRYVGANFEKYIGDVEITVKSLGNAPIKLEYINQVSDYKSDNGIFKLEVGGSSGLLKCSVSLPQDYFEELVYIPMDKIKGYREPIEAADIIGIASIVVVIFSFFFFITFSIIRTRKLRKKIDDDPKLIDKYIKRYEDEGIEVLKIIKRLIYTIYPMQIVTIEILDLIRRDQASISKDNITISKQLNGIDKEIIDVVLKYIKYKEEGHSYKFDIVDLTNFISTTDKKELRDVSDMYKDLSKIKLQLDKDFKFETDELTLLRMSYDVYPEYKSINTYDVFDNIISNKKTPDYKTLIALGISDYKSTNDAENSTMPILLFSTAVDTNIVKEKTTSSSTGGCSSCSSCSSCGGCGGGGAD